MLLGRRSTQQADGVLPVVPGVLAKFIQDHLLGLSTRLLVALMNRPQILNSPLAPQPGGLLFSVLVGLHSKWRAVVPFGYILGGAIRRVDRAESSHLYCSFAGDYS